MDDEKWVIVVDDDISNLKIAGTILSEADMRVTALNSGTALLDYIREGNSPDLVLLDVLMPVLDGFGTMKRLREELHSDIPVIFLTADENSETAERGKNIGAADFIRKPFEAEMLVSRVQRVLNGQSKPIDFEQLIEPSDETSAAIAESAKKSASDITTDTDDDMVKVSMLFDEGDASRGALLLGQDTFGTIYRYLVRHMQRYNGSAYKVLFTVEPIEDDMTDTELFTIAERFGERVRGMLRNSDIMLRYSPAQYFLMLPMVSVEDIPKVTERIAKQWSSDVAAHRVRLHCTIEPMGCVRKEMPEVNGLDWRYARVNLPTDKLLEDTVTDFFNSMQGRLERLNGSYDCIDNDVGALDSYRIEVHAMKSSSAMVGMIMVSGLARLLENYAKESRTDKIHALHPIFAEQWETARQDLGKALGLLNEDEIQPDGREVLPSLLGVLRSGIEEMDIDAIDRTLTKISSYSYDEETTALIRKLREAAMELDDSAEEIIKELLQ